MVASRRPLVVVAATFTGVAAVGCAMLAAPLSTNATGHETVSWVFEAFRVLSLNAPGGAAPSTLNTYGTAARLLALAFVALSVVGIAFEVSPAFRQWGRRRLLRLRWRKTERDGRPVVMIGMGSVGAALSIEAHRDKHPVYALTLDADTLPVQTARRAGVLVEIGDATTPEGLARLPLADAAEVFIATGDDVRNVEIAGAILQRQTAHPSPKGRTVYVHITDPLIGEGLEQQELLPDRVGSTSFQLFGHYDTAALQLAQRLHGDLRPNDDETVHVVLVGFGPLGQTVALRLVRLLHFPNERHLRLTILYRPDEREAVARFRGLHPAFAPGAGFSLAGYTLEHGIAADRWHHLPATLRPDGQSWQTRDLSGDVYADAVEFAALAEFVETETPVSPATIELLTDRFTEVGGLKVRPAIVVATEDEHLNARYAVSVQSALSVERCYPSDPPRRKDKPDTPDLSPPGLPQDGIAEVVPIYPHLLDDEGLTVLVDRLQTSSGPPMSRGAWINHYRLKTHPILPFGLRRDTASYRLITDPTTREDARRIRHTYRVLANQEDDGPVPAGFGLSDLDAATLAVLTLERYFEETERWRSLPAGSWPGLVERPVLAAAAPPTFSFPYEPDAEKTEGCVQSGDTWCCPALAPAPYPHEGLLTKLLEMPPEDVATEVRARFKGSADAPGAWTHLLHPRIRCHRGEKETVDRRRTRERVIEQLAAWASAHVEHDQRRARMLEERRGFADYDASGATLEVLASFERDVDRISSGLAEKLARMEHNRWMAERLVFGWRQGERNDAGRRRTTFRAWDNMRDEMGEPDIKAQLFDRAHLPRLILERQPRPGETGRWFYVRRKPLDTLRRVSHWPDPVAKAPGAATRNRNDHD